MILDCLSFARSLARGLYTGMGHVSQCSDKGTTSLEIRASDEDVQMYLDSRIPQLLQSNISKVPELQSMIKREVLKAVDGMYVLPSINL